MVGGEHSLKTSAPQLYDVLRLGGKGSLNDLMNYEAVCRRAPATPGLVNMYIYIDNFLADPGTAICSTNTSVTC